MAEPRAARLAVLIDADNASARIAPGLFEEIAKLGEASARRIYGDFSSTRLKAWADLLSSHGIIPQQTFAYTAGKNASDIALVIDAMDLLHTGRFDGFCLVSSDSDFTRLAARIREHGLDVYGFGEQKTPESFRQVCKQFIYTENLLPEPIVVVPDTTVRPAGSRTVLLPSKAVPLLKKAITQLAPDGKDWVSMSNVGSQLLKLAPDFDSRNYGHKQLSFLINSASQFEVKKRDGGGMLVRIRPPTSKSAKAD